MVVLLGCPEKAPPTVAPTAKVAPAPPAEDAGIVEPPKSERLPALVLSLGGVVEVRRKGSTDWVALALGDPVQVGDQVRIGADGQLELSFDVAEIKLHEGAELELTLLEPREVRATVEAEKPGGGVARTRGGRVSFSFDGRTATAGALAGEASLTTGDQTVALKEGEFAATKEAGLTQPAKIPKTVSLAVFWPPETATNKRTLRIKGRASVRATVAVGGRKVEPAADGSFEGTVELKKGRQMVTVTALDPFGRRVTRARSFLMDPEAIKIKGAVEYH